MFISQLFAMLYQRVYKSSFTHSVNYLFNCMQTNDAGAFLVSARIPGFTLYREQINAVAASHHQKTQSNNKHRQCPN